MAKATSTRQRTDPELDALLTEWDQEHKPEFDPMALACLTLVPVWTRLLADRCKFPRREAWDEFLANAEAANLVQQGPSVVAGDPQTSTLHRFWMLESARPVTRQQLNSQHERGWLAHWAIRLGEMIANSPPDDPAVPSITRRWAELVSEHSTPRLGDTGRAALMLSRRVSELADKGEIGDARTWIEAGQVLAAALGGPLTDAVALARHRVGLVFRQEVDRRYLARFVERQEQLDAFRELLTGPDDLWALHYLGMGGVGKTMLLRLIGDLAPREYRAAVARVDFDYLSPDYPVRHPGHLLLALAEDLRRHFTEPEHQRAYEALHAALDYLYEVIGGEPPPSDLLANLHRPEFDEALGLFTALLESLLRTSAATSGSNGLPIRVVLVLDTCEEVVKLQFGDALPHLAGTFEIIERMHRRVPAVRVILSGRRLLTLGGVGWRAGADHLPEAKSYLLPVKSYLRLHLIRGFDRDEAGQLFKRFETAGRSLPPDAREAILAVSAEHGTPATLQADDGRPLLLPADLYERLRTVLSSRTARDRMDALTDDERLGLALRSLPATDRSSATIDVLLEKNAPDGGNMLVLLLRELAKGNGASEAGAVADELEALLTRYSPFSLSLYAQWYVDDQKLTAERIQSSEVDPYVELRIVRRISQEQVRRLLPAVVLLRRFTADMLALAFTGDPTDYPAVFGALSDNEWLDYRRDPETNTVWLEVDANLYPQLRAYFEKSDPGALAEVRRLLGPKLAERVRDPLRGQAAERIAAALGLLPDTEAAQLWSEVEWRMPEEADWSWGLKVARFALNAEADIANSPRPLVSAALRATCAAANLQLSFAYDPGPAWRQVAQTLAQVSVREADAPLGRWLAARAELGQVAAARLRGRAPDAAELNAVRMILEERASRSPTGLKPHQVGQLDASLLAALESIVDAAEEADDRSLLPDAHHVGLWATKTTDARHRVLAKLLQGRTLSLQGYSDSAREALVGAETLADGAAVETWVPSRWADWRAPTLLRQRVRLEWLRLHPDIGAGSPEETPARRLERWLSDLANREALSQIDGERLASAALGRLLDWGPVGIGLLADLEGPYRYAAARQAACLAHRQTPPLFLALARGWLAIGEVVRAERMLLDFQQGATISAVDALVVAASQRGLIEIARRTRDSERARALLAGQAGQGWPEPDAWAMAALTGTLAVDEVPAPAETCDDARLHAWWRAQHSLTPARLEQAAVVAARARTQNEPGTAAGAAASLTYRELETRAGLILDARERALVAGEEDNVTSQSLDLLLQLTTSPRSQQWPVEVQASLRLLLRWIALDAFPVAVGAPVQTLMERGWLAPEEKSNVTPLLRRLVPGAVGSRRAAEIALDEGELLALRLPGRAAPVLERAHDWFLEVGDVLGATQAAILWTLAAIRSGAVADARRGLTACQSAYERLRGARSNGELPEWGRLEAQAAASDLAGLDRATQTAWREWIARLVGCLLWQAKAKSSPQDVDWLAVLAQLEEFKLGPAGAELLPASPAQPAETERPTVKSGSTPLGIALIVGGSLLFVAGILVGGYFGFRALLARFAPSVAGGAISVGLYAAALLLLGLAKPGSRRMRTAVRSRLGSRAEIDIDIRPTLSRAGVTAAATGSETSSSASGGDAPGILADIRLQRRELTLGIWPPFLRWGLPVIQQGPAGIAASRPYAEASIGISPQVRDDLLALAERAGRRGIVARLLVAPEMATHPWEAWLNLAVAQKAKSPLTLRFVRVSGPVPLQPFAPGEVRVAVGEKWAGLFEGAWLGHRRLDRPRVGPEAHGVNEHDAVRVLHAVGRPIMTRSGPRLQVERGGYRSESYAQKALSRDIGDLLGAQDLAQPALRQVGRLVIVQAEPAEGVANRGIGRGESAHLRALAAEAFAGGVPVVLVLPALPPDLVNRAVGHVARALGQFTPSRPSALQPWLHAVDCIRHEILAWNPPVVPTTSAEEIAASLTETAWDVGVSWRSERGSVTGGLGG